MVTVSTGAVASGPERTTARPAPEPTVASTASESTVPRRATTAPRASAVSSTSAPEQPTEIELLKQAQAALGSQPQRALSLVARAAQLYPRGALGQEREMIRIQALAATGRRGQALAAAAAFKKGNPRSAYCRRLEALFPELKGK